MGIPFGVLLIYLAFTAKIRADDTHFYYTMLYTRTIPWTSITALKLKPMKTATVKVGVAGRANFAHVIPLEIYYNGKKTTISLYSFVNPEGIMALLEQKTGLVIEPPKK